MLQREAESTLMELTHGLGDLDQTQKSAQKKRIPLTAAKTAGFIEAGSGLYMAVESKDLDTKEGSFWEVKADETGQPVLERMSTDFDLEEAPSEKKKEASGGPEFFSTPTDLYEHFQDRGGSVTSVGDGQFVATDAEGNRITYQDQNDKVVRLGGDHSEELQRRASNGNEPPIRTIPEGVELDVTNKYQEQGKERELSLSEQSDKTQLEEDLKTKGLTGLEFD